MSIHRSGLPGDLSTISCGDCAIEIERYPETGTHILIDTPDGERMELWITLEGLLVIDAHTITGTLPPSGEIPETADTPDNLLTLTRRTR